MRKHVVFISLPMSGLSTETIEQNLAEAKEYYLNHSGMDIRDVAFIDNHNCPPPLPNPCYERLPDSRPPIWYLSQALVGLSIADEVLFFRGWKNARGCRVEKDVCEMYDIPYHDMVEVIESEN